MTDTTNTPVIVRRALTDPELADILAEINAATNTVETFTATTYAVYTTMLAGHDLPHVGFGVGQNLDPRQFQIPASQWQAIVTAAINRAQEWGTAADIAVHFANLMPCQYDDPTIPAPALHLIDRRPDTHTLHISREATDVIAACADHVAALGRHYGTDSPIYHAAATSWAQRLAGLFTMTTGALTHISRDGDKSLYVTTSSGLVYGLIFHSTSRRCTVDGCQARLTDDGIAYTTAHDAVIGEHEHRPSYPFDAPQPGTWSIHS
jgi:hypothetical protein